MLECLQIDLDHNSRDDNSGRLICFGYGGSEFGPRDLMARVVREVMTDYKKLTLAFNFEGKRVKLLGESQLAETAVSGSGLHRMVAHREVFLFIVNFKRRLVIRMNCQGQN